MGTDSFNAADFRAFQKVFAGISNNYIIRGLEITAVTGLSATIGIANSAVFCGLDNTSSFYVAGSDEQPVTVTVPGGYPNIYIEAVCQRVTGTKVNTAFWDPSIPTNTNSAGSEFLAPADFQEFVQLVISSNTTGFSPTSIKIAVVSTSSSAILTVTPAREMFYRLGTGGAIPNPNNSFGWSNNRRDAVVTGPASSIGTQNSNNPYLSSDGVGAVNDFAITSIKQWMDAVMSSIKSLNGTPYWFMPFGGTSGGTAPSLSLFQYDSTFNRMLIRNHLSAISWSSSSDFKLRGLGTVPTQWEYAFGGIVINLGNVFDAGKRTFTDPDFVSPVVGDKSALYLKLNREYVPIPANNSAFGGNTVSFGQSAIGSNAANICIVGNAGDFTGIALGDYIRRVGDPYFSYVRVNAIISGSKTSTTTVIKTSDSTATGTTVTVADGTVATSSIDGLIVDTAYSTPTSDKYYTFQTSYDSSSLYSSQSPSFFTAINSASTVIPLNNLDLMIVGIRSGNNFNLEGFGVLSGNQNTDTSSSVVSVSTSTSATTSVPHGFAIPTMNYIFQAYDTTGSPVVPSAVMVSSITTTGIVLAITGTVKNVTVMFQKIR
jgi:hypothetical protein